MSSRPAAPSVTRYSKRGARVKPLMVSRSNAREKRRLRAGAPRPGAIRLRRPGVRGGPLARPPGRALIGADGVQEREPGRLLEVGLGGDLRRGPRRLEPAGSREQRRGEPLGVGRRPQARDQRVAVAVVGGALQAAGDDAGGAPAPARASGAGPRGAARGRRAGARRRLGAQLCLELARADRAVRGQAVVAAEERHARTAGDASASGVTYPPRAGDSVTERRRTRSPRPAALSAHRSATARRTSRISSAANAAPAQRRTPPPNGSQANGSGAPSRKRSGRNAVGSGHSSGRRCARYGHGVTWTPGGSVQS